MMKYSQSLAISLQPVNSTVLGEMAAALNCV